MDEREVEAVRRSILSGWITQGPEVAAFEREFAASVGASYACAVSSCTTALHVALRALGVGTGDEVVTVSHSFIATANAIRYCDALPVFVDVQLDTLNLDTAQLEGAISRRTKAILPVHQIGMPCDMPAVMAIARRHGIPVIEDAACAVGSMLRVNDGWDQIGKPHGDVACFSFHPRKLLSTGDGGMLTTNDPELDRQFRLLRQHGMSVPDTVRHRAQEVIFEDYPVPGYNYRMTDIQAAIGRVQLKRLPEMVAQRRMRAARYQQLLSRVAGVHLLVEPEWARTNWQSYAIRLDPGISQRTVMQRMLEDGVATRRGVMNSHQEGAYACGGWSAPSSLTRSEQARDTMVILPLYHQMTDEEQDQVVRSLTSAMQR